ncbi:unnamed protein product, partial [Brassica rapa]
MSPPELQRGKENNPSFELKIISANDVSLVNAAYKMDVEKLILVPFMHFNMKPSTKKKKMDVYAAVSITGVTTQQKQSAKTPIDFYGCFNPTWNHTVKFSIAEEAVQFTLTVKLFSYW